MLGFLGETKLALIPKVSNPTQAKEFRPIYCYDVIYKCVAKLLSIRLKEVLPYLIRQYQGHLWKKGSCYLIFSFARILPGVFKEKDLP